MNPGTGSYLLVHNYYYYGILVYSAKINREPYVIEFVVGIYYLFLIAVGVYYVFDQNLMWS